MKIKLRSILMLTIAGMVNAFGVTMFLTPVHLYDSGFSGTSMLLSQVTPEHFSLSVFLIVLNVPFFIYGLKKLGPRFTAYSVYAVAVFAFAAWFITNVLKVDTSVTSPLAGKDLLLCALFGGLISGTGSGIALRAGGAIDGIEVLAVVFAKRFGITVGTFVMIYNVILYFVCGFVINSWILPLYSIVTYFAALKTVDFITEGIDRAKSATIITTRPEEICAALSEAFGSGLTLLDAKGFYSAEQKTMIYFVVNRFQIGRMREIVHDIDCGAFISISEVADVFGSCRK